MVHRVLCEVKSSEIPEIQTQSTSIFTMAVVNYGLPLTLYQMQQGNMQNTYGPHWGSNAQPQQQQQPQVKKGQPQKPQQAPEPALYHKLCLYMIVTQFVLGLLYGCYSLGVTKAAAYNLFLCTMAIAVVYGCYRLCTRKQTGLVAVRNPLQRSPMETFCSWFFGILLLVGLVTLVLCFYACAMFLFSADPVMFTTRPPPNGGGGGSSKGDTETEAPKEDSMFSKAAISASEAAIFVSDGVEAFWKENRNFILPGMLVYTAPGLFPTARECRVLFHTKFNMTKGSCRDYAERDEAGYLSWANLWGSDDSNYKQKYMECKYFVEGLYKLPDYAQVKDEYTGLCMPIYTVTLVLQFVVMVIRSKNDFKGCKTLVCIAYWAYFILLTFVSCLSKFPFAGRGMITFLGVLVKSMLSPEASSRWLSPVVNEAISKFLPTGSLSEIAAGNAATIIFAVMFSLDNLSADISKRNDEDIVDVKKVVVTFFMVVFSWLIINHVIPWVSASLCKLGKKSSECQEQISRSICLPINFYLYTVFKYGVVDEVLSWEKSSQLFSNGKLTWGACVFLSCSFFWLSRHLCVFPVSKKRGTDQDLFVERAAALTHFLVYVTTNLYSNGAVLYDGDLHIRINECTSTEIQ